MGNYSSNKAYHLIRQYTAQGEDQRAARIYAENPISFTRYQAARTEGLRERERMTQDPAARNTTTITTGPGGDQ